MNRKEIEQKYAIDAAGAGVVNPDFKMKTGVEKRLKGLPVFDVNRHKKIHEQKLKSLKASYEQALKEAKTQEDKDQAKRWYERRVKDENEFWNDLRHGRRSGMNVKTHYMAFPETRPSRKGADGWGWFKKDSAELNDTIRFQSDRKQTGQNVVGAFGGRSVKEWTNGTKEQPYLGLGKGDYRKRMNANQGIDKLAAKKSNDTPAKVLNIKIAKNSSGGYDGQVYYSKNGEKDLVSPFGVYANGKWAFPFGRTSTRLTEKDKKIIEDKIKRLLAQKGFVVKDSAEFENDAVVLRKVAKPDPEDSYITIMMPDGKLSDHTWNSVKKAMDFVIQGNYKGAKVVGFPSRKVLAK